jgi:WD40 repeat protein
MRLITLTILLAPVNLLAQAAPDITPVYTKYCQACHSKAVRMGAFDMESEEGLRQGGHRGPVIVPGKPEESRLFQMVTGQFKPVMPMDGTKLTAGEIELVAAWIKAGAPAMKAKAAESSTLSYKPKAVRPQVFSLAFSPDGALVATGGFREVNLVDAASGRVLATLKGHADAVRSVAFSPDGKLLAAAGGFPAKRGEVKIWNVATRELVRTLEGHKDCIHSVVFSKDSAIATASYDKMVRLWSLDGASRELKDHIDAVYSLAFTPDGKRLVSGAADRTIKIWDVASGNRLFTLSEPTDGVNAVEVSPDGSTVAAAGQDKSIRLWRLSPTGGTLLNTSIAHEDAILDIAFSPDGTKLVSASSDRSIKVFSLPKLDELRVLTPQSDWPYAVLFSPDGKTIAAGRYDGSLSFYDAATYQDRVDSRKSASR